MNPPNLITNTYFVSVGILIALYFIGGAFYNYKQYNARGLDLIPHRGTVFYIMCRILYTLFISKFTLHSRFLVGFTIFDQGKSELCYPGDLSNFLLIEMFL